MNRRAEGSQSLKVGEQPFILKYLASRPSKVVL